MRFSASSMGFPGPEINNMALLPKDFGIEIFYEWGSADYWNDALDLIMRERTGGFSIHSPFNNVDICMPCDEESSFTYCARPLTFTISTTANSMWCIPTDIYPPIQTNSLRPIAASAQRKGWPVFMKFASPRASAWWWKTWGSAGEKSTFTIISNF